MVQMDTDSSWIFRTIQSSGEYLSDIRQMLSWFDDESLTMSQLEDALEEYSYHNNLQHGLLACRHTAIIAVDESAVEIKPEET
jgi:hypothetical protein